MSVADETLMIRVIPKPWSMHRMPLGIIMALMMTESTGPARGQGTQGPSPATSNPSAQGTGAGSPEGAASNAGHDQDALADFRPPLLREGSRLVEATGRIRRDPSSGWWLLKVESDSPTAAAPAFELILLPGTLLSEMQHIVESTPSQQVTFEVTGEVYVYRGRNFIMPAHAPKLNAHQAVPAATTTNAPTVKPTTRPAAASTTGPATLAPDSAASSPSATMPEPIKPGDSAQDIMRNLEQSIGPAPGHVAARQGSDVSKDNPNSAHTAGKTFNSEGAGSGVVAERVLQEGTAVISRRGKLTRDPSGGWMFIFDADATGLIDPPMRLLPCLLLQELEKFARHNASGAAILISGQVYLYGGRNFLLPTAFRVPRERTNITP